MKKTQLTNKIENVNKNVSLIQKQSKQNQSILLNKTIEN